MHWCGIVGVLLVSLWFTTAAARSCQSAPNVMLVGDVITFAPAPTVASCCLACQEESQCVAGSFNPAHLCTLFSHVTAANKSVNTTSLLLGGAQQLPDQVAMQLFVSTFSTLTAFCVDPTWTPATYVCEWWGVTCNTTTNRVTSFKSR